MRAPELLLERERELELIELAAARAAEADASMVLIEGSAGVGKTRLLREAAARVENQRISRSVSHRGRGGTRARMGHRATAVRQHG